jgi:antitoxin HicB
VQIKQLLVRHMDDAKVRPADLARAMGVPPQNITRLTDLNHVTKIDTLADAFRAMGVELKIELKPLEVA